MHDATIFLDMIADGIDAIDKARNTIARAAVKFATPIPHVCDPGWQYHSRTPDNLRQTWTLNVVCAMPEGTAPGHVRAAGAVCQSLRIELNPLAVGYNDDVSILDAAGNVAGVTLFLNLPESLQLDLVDALKAKREQATRAEGEIIGREWAPECPLDDEFKPREVKPQVRDLTTEYVCARWSRGVRVAKCDNAAGDTHYYVFDVASGEATARVGSKNAAFDRARDQGIVTNG